MRQRKLEFDRKAKEKWGNVSDKLAGTTKRGGKAKKYVAQRNLAILAGTGNAVDEEERAEKLAQRAVLVRAFRGVVTTWKRGNGGTCRA